MLLFLLFPFDEGPLIMGYLWRDVYFLYPQFYYKFD